MTLWGWPAVAATCARRTSGCRLVLQLTRSRLPRTPVPARGAASPPWGPASPRTSALQRPRNFVKPALRPVCVQVVCTCVCTCAHMYMYMHALVCVRTQVCIHVCVYVGMYLCMCKCVFACVCMCASTHACARACVCMCVTTGPFFFSPTQWVFYTVTDVSFTLGEIRGF